MWINYITFNLLFSRRKVFSGLSEMAGVSCSDGAVTQHGMGCRISGACRVSGKVCPFNELFLLINPHICRAPTCG